MTLETIDIFNGILLIFILAISVIVGLKIISLYFKNKEKVYIFAGLTWIFLVCPWYPHVTSFILVLTTEKGIENPEVYFTLGNIFIPIAIISWLYAFTELFYKNKQLIIISIYVLYAIIFYVLFFTALYILKKPILIGKLQGDIEVKYSTLIVLYDITILITLLITGIFFGIQSMKSDNPEIKLRGKLIVVAFISYVVGITIDAVIVEHSLVSLIFVRILEISSVVEFYAAFIMPDFLKRRIIK